MGAKRNTREWWVSGWSRPRPGTPEPPARTLRDEDGREYVMREVDDPAHVEQGAAITDTGTGVRYRATIAHDTASPYLTSLEIERTDDAPINSRLLASVPVERIAAAVAQYLRETEGVKPSEVLILGPEAVHGRGFVPDLEELARRYKEYSGTRRAFTQEIEGEYGVSRATVGRWIAKARDEGFLPESKQGRPRNLNAKPAANPGTDTSGSPE